MDNLLQNITIYHKTSVNTWERYNIVASVRDTSYLNRNKTGVQTTDKALIRVFNTDGYNNTWKCEKGDIIVKNDVYDQIEKAPITELSKKYGNNNVYEVSSIDVFDFKDQRLRKINHIKIGAR